MSNSSFQIEVRFLGGLTPAQKTIFQVAATRWSEVITADVPSVDTDIGMVDDLVIDAEGVIIDGQGGVLGRAGPTRVRPGSLLPARGIMQFDLGDLKRMERDGSLVSVILHEMGHVLGLGTLWRMKGFIEATGTDDPLYIGTEAMDAYGQLIGAGSPRKVPIANGGGPGTREGHWREDTFGNELMTGYLNSGLNPLSLLTVAALRDLGYHVNLNASDAYRIPSSLAMALITLAQPQCCAIEIPEVEVLPFEPPLSIVAASPELSVEPASEPLTEDIGLTEAIDLASEQDELLTLVAPGSGSLASANDPVIAWITAEPRLTAIPIRLRLNPGFSLVSLSYQAWIEYRDHGRNDRSNTATGQPNALNFDIHFAGEIRGGTFRIEMPARIRRNADGAIGTGTLRATSNVRGRNPSKATVKEFLGGIEYQVTAYRESRFRQFDSNGRPLFGPPNGFGVMQLDNPPATADQVWNWRANVKAGKALFETKRQQARTYPARVRRHYPEAPDFTPEQLKLEIYQRYNGGAYWRWDPQSRSWRRRPPNGYADASLRIEQAVQAGNPPPSWS